MILCVLKRILYKKKSIFMQLLESPIPPHTEIKIFIFAYGYFTVRLTVRGGGSPSALTGSKVEISQNPKN